MSALRILLVGAGGIAQSHARAVDVTPEASMAAVVDVRKPAAEALAEAVGGKAHADLDGALKAGEYDAAIVCTPPDSHEEIVVRCLRAGMHVLCEKPFAPTLPAARRMVAAAQAADRVITMASKFRHSPDMVRAKAALAGGALGTPMLLTNAFTSAVDMGKRWNADPKVSGGGVLIDNGTHSADIVRYLLGPISAVRADAPGNVQDLPVEDSAHLGLKAGAALAHVELSWSLNFERERYVEVVGSSGVAHIGWKESRYRTRNAGDWTPLGRGYNKDVAFHAQLLNFVNAVRGREPLRIGPEDAVASVAVIEAAYRSLHGGGGWIAVEDAA